MATFNFDKEVFNVKDCDAYPSSNAQNGGQINSEDNIRWIMLRLTKRSFTLSEQDFKIYYEGNSNPSVLCISPGKANIDGYCFNCKEITYIDLNEFFDESSLGELLSIIQVSQSVTLYVKFKKCTDSADHLLAYEEDVINHTISKFLGFRLVLTTEVPASDELYLGTIKVKAKNASLYIDEVRSNKYKCMFINASSIYADEDELGNQDRTLYNLIKYIVSQSFNSGVGDLVLYGNENNRDGTTNIFLSNTHKRDDPQRAAEYYLRLYYNAETSKGGLALVDQFNKLSNPTITNSYDIFTFDFSNTSTPTMKIHINSFTIGDNGITLDNGNVGIAGNLTVGGSYFSDGGNINLTSGNITVTNGEVRAAKVYGAVWS